MDAGSSASWTLRRSIPFPHVARKHTLDSRHHPFGLWEFTRMPFGLKNAGQTFRCLMDRVGANMPFVLFTWMTSWWPVQMLSLAKLTITPSSGLKEFGLVLNLKKCEQGCQTVGFLGHRISAAGVEQFFSVAAIQDCPRPSDMWSLQSNLGAPKILRSLIDALHGSGRVK